MPVLVAVELKWDSRRSKKCQKGHFEPFSDFLTTPGLCKNSFKIFKPPSYMTTRVRNLNPKFADDSTDPA